MRSQKRGACFSLSSTFVGGHLFSPMHLVAEYIAGFQRLMSAMEKHNAKRDRMWPRNYNFWIRAPERFESSGTEQW